MTDWSGRRVQQARLIVAGWLPAPCARCGLEVTPGQRWVVGHKIARSLRPDLVWEVSNWAPEHRECSDRSAQQAVIDKARADAFAEVGIFPHNATPGQPPLLPVSPPEARGGQQEVRSALGWAEATRDAPEWLEPYLAVPGDASVPLAMTPVHPDAVGSYGPGAVEWIESSQRITLRWWQRLAIVRQLEHRADGSLVWRTVVESAPRRAGKSVRVRGLALWRMQHGRDLFGEVQTVMHTGSDVAICREIQRGAWRWAEDVAGWTVSRANGKEAVEADDGSRWLVRSQNAVYGYDCHLGMVDEGWDVSPDTVTEGLEPATLERPSAQVHLTSTAHRRARSTMRTRLAAALADDDGETLLLLWGAPPGADLADPETWRAASPHWSEDRRRMIAAKYAKALAGQDDPEFDDPDPMAGFEAQYVNRWRLREPRVARGTPVVSAEAWTDLVAEVPFVAPDAVAIESWFGEGVSVASAWRAGERAVVSVEHHDDLASAAVAVRESGFRGTATVGASLVKDPALRGVRRRAGEGRTGATVQQMAHLIAEDVVRHDGGEHLSGQLLGARTLPGADGPRLVSTGRADAVKAATWAVTRSRLTRSAKARVLLPTGTTG